jgi:hypothetical protein
MLVRMLDAFVAKFGALTHIIPKIVKRYSLKTGDEPDMADPIEVLDAETVVDIEHLAPIRASSIGIDHYSTDIARGKEKMYQFVFIGQYLKTF